MSDTRIDYSISIRPTRHRLLTAISISACAVVALLALLGTLVDFAENTLRPGFEQGEPLTVHIRNGGGAPNADLTSPDLTNPDIMIDDQVVRSSSQDETGLAKVADLQQTDAPPDSPQQPVVLPPIRDWRSIAGKAVKEIADDQFRQEESRESMWRQSYSVMFQPADDILDLQEKSVIADVRFIPRIHVLGLGLTIGSCFFGIPILGGPVEQRTGAITLVICAQDSG